MKDLEDRLRGVLLGTAVGDALGLPAEGMSARAIARRFGDLDRFRLFGRTGWVSDDTELSALVAQSLARHPRDPDACAQAFRRSLLGFLARLPWGVGLATLRASLRIALGFSRSGIASAGNGAAMRAAVAGVFLRDRPREERIAFGRRLAEVTHTDPRAVEGARDVAALAAGGRRAARAVGAEERLAGALDRAATLAAGAAPLEEAAESLGTTGYVVHTVPLAAFVFARWGDEPLTALRAAIRAGGDTDTTAAIVGAWAGARHGESALPADLVARLHDGPFGPRHLRALAGSLARGEPPPRFSTVAAAARNLALYPVILGHGFRRLATTFQVC